MKIKISIPQIFTYFLLLIVPVLVSYPLLNAHLPRTDASGYLFKTWFLKHSLHRFGKVFNWNPFWYAGYPFLRFYPPLSHWVILVISYFPFISLSKAFNLLLIFSYVLLSFSTYYLCRILGLKRTSSILASFLLVVSPSLMFHTTFSGSMPTIFTFPFVPLALAFLIKSYRSNNWTYRILAIIFSATIFLSHHLTAYFLGIAMCIVFIYALIRKNNIANLFKNYSILIFFTFLLVSFWVIPAFIEAKYSFFKSKSSYKEKEFMGRLFTPIQPLCKNHKWNCYRAIGWKFWIFAFLGLSAIYFSIKKTERGIYLTSSLDRKYLFPLLLLLVLIFLIAVPALGLQSFIPFGKFIQYRRFGLYALLPLAILSSILIEKVPRRYDWIAIFVIMGIFSNYLFISNLRAEKWPTETAPIKGSKNFRSVFNKLKKLDRGRWMTYGTFKPAIVSAIPIRSKKKTLSGWYRQGSHSYAQLAGRIESWSTESAKFMKNLKNKKEYYKVLENGFVKYILINLCHPEARKVYKTFLKDFKILVKVRCIYILKNPSNPTYTKPSLKWKRGNPEKLIFYNVPKGNLLVKESYYPHWKAYCSEKELPINESSFGTTIVHLEKRCKKLKMKYESPFLYRILLLISAITFCILIAFLAKPSGYKRIRGYLKV